MTGRAMGYCAGYETAGFETAPGGRRGMGRWYGPGFGSGRGFRGRGFRGAHPRFRPFGRGMGYGAPWGWAPNAGADTDLPVAPENRRQFLEEEIDALSQRVDYLKRELDATRADEGGKQ